MENVRILVTGGGAPGAFGIISALQRNKKFTVLSCDVQEETVGSKLCKEYFTLPIGTAPEYTECLLKKIKKHKIDVLFPLTTKELLPISIIRDDLKKMGCIAIVSQRYELSIANNKSALSLYLRSENIPVPNFRTVSNLPEFKHALELLNYPKEEVIFKPSIGNGSRGFRIVSNDINRLDLMFNRKPNAVYIGHQEAIDTFKEGKFPELIMSEYLPGREYSVDCLIQEGKTKLVVPRLRSKMNNGISVAGCIEKNQEVIKYCKLILKQLRLNGPIGIQVKYSKADQPLLVEINPRIQGTTVACLGANLNIPELAVLNAIKEPIDWKKIQQNIKWGTRFTRHYGEIYF